MEFVKLASINDVKPNSMMGVTINDQKILLANVNGTYYAIGDKCMHRGCQISKGKLKAKQLCAHAMDPLMNLKQAILLKDQRKNLNLRTN